MRMSVAREPGESSRNSIPARTYVPQTSPCLSHYQELERTERKSNAWSRPESTLMDPDVLSFFQVCAGIVITVGSLVTIGIAAKVVLLRAQRAAQRPPIDDDRLRHLEQAVDAIAIEVERISEGQRFTTKLLADKEGQSIR